MSDNWIKEKGNQLFSRRYIPLVGTATVVAGVATINISGLDNVANRSVVHKITMRCYRGGGAPLGNQVFIGGDLAFTLDGMTPDGGARHALNGVPCDIPISTQATVRLLIDFPARYFWDSLANAAIQTVAGAYTYIATVEIDEYKETYY